MREEYKNIPAFPSLGNIGYNSDWQTEDGMTLRDYFAGQALAGLSQLARNDEPDNMANYCYMIADAMMGRR